MSHLDALRHRLAVLLRPRRYAREIAAEMRVHLELEAMHRRHAGAAEDEAEYAARRRFGNVTYFGEETRRMSRPPVLDALAQDLRYALRTLRKSPGFAVAAVLTLALAIGANTAIFSAVEAVLLHPLPVRGLDQVVTIETDFPARSLHHAALAPGEVYDLMDRHDLFQAVAGYRAASVNLTGAGEPQRITAVSTIGPFFDVFGVQPYLGRFYDSTDVARGNMHVAVLSYGFWRQLTGGDRHALHTTLRIDDRSYEVVGVLPPGFRYPRSVQLWTPQSLQRGVELDRDNRCCKLMTVVGRRYSGVTMSRLRDRLAAEMTAWTERLPQSYPSGLHQALVATPFISALAGQLRPILLLLLGAVGVVLLIACANIASLQLVRTTGRAKELAIRGALGAGRGIIVRQLAAESLVVAAAGGAVGIVVGDALIHLLARSDAARFAMLRDVRLDPLVLSVSVAVTVMTALLFGIMPALRAARVDPGEVLTSTSTRGASAGVGRSRFLRTAVVVQVALALVLLLGSGIALRSLVRVLAVDPGFKADGLITLRLELPDSRYTNAAAKLAFHDALLQRLRAMPGIQAAAMVNGVPFGHLGEAEHTMIIHAAVKPAGASQAPVANLWTIGGDYFRTMGIPLRAGRAFSAADRGGAPPVAIIDEPLARALFPGRDAVGQRLARFGVIVGVVGPVKKTDLTGAQRGAIYFPARQWPGGVGTVVVRTTLPTTIAAGLLRRAVHALDAKLPASGITSMPEDISRSLGPRRLASTVLGAFAVLAFFLAALGIYGVLSYSTSQRTKEIGIRLALGASPAGVVRMVLGNGAVLTGVGVLIGMLVFVALGHLLSALVFGISVRDPLTMAAGMVVLTVVALVASWLPARRAAGVDPAMALRAE